MKKIISLFIIACTIALTAKAQFGFAKKEDIEKFKDARLVVVLFADSNYNASIQAAVEQFWNFNGGVEFVPDSMMKKYNKPEFYFLTFSRSKKSSKIKAKLCSSEEDFNGLIITNKYRKRSKTMETIAQAYCSNAIDTTDWYPEMVRAVQILNNYFTYALQAEGDKEISVSYMLNNYPGNLSVAASQKLLVETGMLQMKGKEEPAILLGNEVEDVDRDEINKAIMAQNPEVMYMYHSFDEKYCTKIFVSAANSEVMHVISTAADKCKCTGKDLKSFKQRIDKANKED